MSKKIFCTAIRFVTMGGITLILSACGGGNGPVLTNGGVDSWTLMTSGTTNTLRSIWGSGALNIYAAGRETTLLHFDGTDWSVVSESDLDVTPGNTGHSASLWGTSASNIYMTGANGIYHYNGATWSFIQNLGAAARNPDFTSIWASSETDVYATGLYLSTYQLFHSTDPTDATSWSRVITGFNYIADQVRGSSPSNIYVAGIPTVHFDGTSWTTVMMGGSPVNSERVFVVSDTSVYLIGNNTVYHYDGIGWTSTDHGLITDEDIWASSGSNIYVAGNTDGITTGLAHNDGSSWTALPDETSDNGAIYALWGVGDNDIFGVGSLGKIIRYRP